MDVQPRERPKDRRGAYRASHVVMLSQPQIVANLIEEAAKETN